MELCNEKCANGEKERSSCLCVHTFLKRSKCKFPAGRQRSGLTCDLFNSDDDYILRLGWPRVAWGGVEFVCLPIDKRSRRRKRGENGLGGLTGVRGGGKQAGGGEAEKEAVVVVVVVVVVAVWRRRRRRRSRCCPHSLELTDTEGVEGRLSRYWIVVRCGSVTPVRRAEINSSKRVSRVSSEIVQSSFLLLVC